jgi:translation initiation factor 4B
LELKPRSEHPIEPGPASAVSIGESSKSNPFGAARPIDTAQREKEVAEKRAAATAARKAMEEKAKEEKKIRAAAEADKQSEAGTPTSNSTRNPSLSGRTSEGASGGVDEDREDQPKKNEDRSSKVTGSWRAARNEPKEKAPGKEPKIDTSKVPSPGAAEDEDGWTVAGKRGRGNANGTKNSATGSS